MKMDGARSDEFDTAFDFLAELGRKLNKSRYAEFCASFLPSNIGTHRWNTKRDEIGGEVGELVDLLLLGRKIRFAHLRESTLSHDELDRLCKLGVLARDDTCVWSPSLSLVSVLGNWLFVQRPQLNPTIYIGHDSFGLMNRIRASRNDRALDLCAGPGAQGIQLARFAKSVTLVDVNFIASNVSLLNIALNDLADKVQVVSGDLYGALAAGTEKFDVIVANPPLLPFPKDSFYPFVGHGGEDGLQITWRILSGLSNWLNASGHAQIIGTCLSDGIVATVADAIDEWARKNQYDVTMTIVGHAPFQPGTVNFDGLIATAVASDSTQSVEDCTNRLKGLVDKNGATHLAYFYLLVRKGLGGLETMDISDDITSTLWFV